MAKVDTCDHQCGSCGEDCASREGNTDLRAKLNERSTVKKVIGVVSGKGGVGKSLVTALLATEMQKRQKKTAIMDADITGPSIPKLFGVHKKAIANEFGVLPEKSAGGIELMSINLLLPDESMPVIWRGPIIAGTVTQFWTDVVWGDIDYLFVDMPPGTGDVALTVFQSLPLDGLIIVTSPQELVSMIVGKAVNMAQQMNIPILGMIENMSYVQCPDCDKQFSIFGESHVQETAEKYGLTVLDRLPLNPNIAKACDEGKIESLNNGYLQHTADYIEKMGEEK